MTAYLVLDFQVTDLRGFMPYVEQIPAFRVTEQGGRVADTIRSDR